MLLIHSNNATLFYSDDRIEDRKSELELKLGAYHSVQKQIETDIVI